MIFLKKLALSVSVATIGMTLGSLAFADDAKSPGSGPSPYSDCGIGAALFPDTNWAAVTSNVIWDLGSTAITSATSSPQTCSGKKQKTAMFIGHTYAQLTEETAAGHGKYLATALSLFECAPAKQAEVIDQVRAEMAKNVAAPAYLTQTRLEKAADYYNAMDRAAKQSCSI